MMADPPAQGSAGPEDKTNTTDIKEREDEGAESSRDSGFSSATDENSKSAPCSQLDKVGLFFIFS